MTRKLQIVFYGMACFAPLPQGGGYRVLIPDGRDMKHVAVVWVRKKKKTAAARWPFVLENDFFIADPYKLTITGLNKTPLDTKRFDDRLVNLKDCDPQFEIAKKPETMVDMVIDRGTLSAHVINKDGMLVVKWVVEANDRVAVRLNFGEYWIEPEPNTDQVVLVNSGFGGLRLKKFEKLLGPLPSLLPPLSSLFGPNHFLIYRKLSTEPKKPLPFKNPKKPTKLGGVTLIEPSDIYELATPNVKCSPVCAC